MRQKLDNFASCQFLRAVTWIRTELTSDNRRKARRERSPPGSLAGELCAGGGVVRYNVQESFQRHVVGGTPNAPFTANMELGTSRAEWRSSRRAGRAQGALDGLGACWVRSSPCELRARARARGVTATLFPPPEPCTLRVLAASCPGRGLFLLVGDGAGRTALQPHPHTPARWDPRSDYCFTTRGLLQLLGWHSGDNRACSEFLSLSADLSRTLPK